MSFDGKAEVVLGQAPFERTTSVVNNKLNVAHKRKASSSSTHQDQNDPNAVNASSKPAVDSTRLISEYECVENLLRLRNGTWA